MCTHLTLILAFFVLMIIVLLMDTNAEKKSRGNKMVPLLSQSLDLHCSL